MSSLLITNFILFLKLANWLIDLVGVLGIIKVKTDLFPQKAVVVPTTQNENNSTNYMPQNKFVQTQASLLDQIFFY
jgi:hypothetical protein